MTTLTSTLVSAAGLAVVSLRDVSASYGDSPALEHVSLEVGHGELVAVVGPNGAGKSSLLKVIAGLLKPWQGVARVLGETPGAAGRRIAYVPQAELVDWQFPISVGQVVMMGRYQLLGPLRRPGAADARAVRGALEKVGMAAFADRQIGALSGGQRRRVFLARALASEAALFLLDEPVTGIDVVTQDEIMDVLTIEAAGGRTVIATTHDLAFAAQRFGRVIVVNRSLVADGPASLALDRSVLARAYGGHFLVLEGGGIVLDDAHHHDEPPARERHFHEGGG